MQIKLGQGVLVTGRATKDAELKLVGAKDSPVAQFSIAAGKREDDTTIFVEIKAWYRLAEYAEGIRKGDAVCAVGEIEEREYNGKIYKTLVADWLNYADGGKKQAAYKPPLPPVSKPSTIAAPPFKPVFVQVEDEVDPLPF